MPTLTQSRPLLPAGMPELFGEVVDFLHDAPSGEARSWIRIPGADIYLRKTERRLHKVTVPTLEIAAVVCEDGFSRTERLRALTDCLRILAPGLTLVLDCVVDAWLSTWAFERGWLPVPGTAPVFYLPPAKTA